MHLGKVVRFLDKHPWLGIGTGLGLAVFSVLKIRRERKDQTAARRETKALKAERREAKRLARGAHTH